MGLSYATEWFSAWYGGEHADRSVIAYEFTGHYGVLYCVPAAVQRGAAAGALVAAARRSLLVLVLVSIGIN